MSDYIYFFQSVRTGSVKIGYSKRPLDRLKYLQTAASDELRCLAIIAGNRDDERGLHERFSVHRLKGEWFAPAEEILSHGRTHSIEFRGPNAPKFERLQDENTDWLMARAAVVSDRIGSRNVGLTEKAFQNLRNGKSKIGFDGLVAWCRNDPSFAAHFAAFVGLIAVQDVEFTAAITEAFNAYQRKPRLDA